MAVGNICIEFNQEQLDELKSYIKKEIEKEIKSIESRPKGEWLDSEGKERIKSKYCGHCSICGGWSEYLTDFCGNCGADMRGEE